MLFDGKQVADMRRGTSIASERDRDWDIVVNFCATRPQIPEWIVKIFPDISGGRMYRCGNWKRRLYRDRKGYWSRACGRQTWRSGWRCGLRVGQWRRSCYRVTRPRRRPRSGAYCTIPRCCGSSKRHDAVFFLPLLYRALGERAEETRCGIRCKKILRD